MGLAIHTSLAQREAERRAAPMRADRRLWLTADKSRLVEEGDPAAAFLFAPAGGEILQAEIDHYRLGADGARVLLPDS